MLDFYSQEQEIFALDLGVAGGIGLTLDNVVYHAGERLEDFLELKNLDKLDFFMHEMYNIMEYEYEHLFDTEDFDD
jgi:hypothetical protein